MNGIIINPEPSHICLTCLRGHAFSPFDWDLVEVRKLNKEYDNECLWCHLPMHRTDEGWDT